MIQNRQSKPRGLLIDPPAPSRRHLNMFQLIGTIVAEPVLRTIPGTGNRILVLEVETTGDLQRHGEVMLRHKERHRLVIESGQAVALAEDLEAGATVYAQGSLRSRQRENRRGHKWQEVDIVVSHIQKLHGGQDET